MFLISVRINFYLRNINIARFLQIVTIEFIEIIIPIYKYFLYLICQFTKTCPCAMLLYLFNSSTSVTNGV